MNRRHFLRSGAAALATTGLASAAGAGTSPAPLQDVYSRLDAAAARPVLDRSLFPEPVIIDRIEFLRNGETYLVRVRAKNGAEGIAISNERDIGYLFPVAQRLMIPYLIGKDARDWEALIEGVYLPLRRFSRKRSSLPSSTGAPSVGLRAPSSRVRLCSSQPRMNTERCAASSDARSASK